MGDREKLAKNLPGWLVDLAKENFGSFAADAYRAPSNKSEQKCWSDLTAKGYTVLRRGWPDFCVFGGGDDMFMVEVKRHPDVVRPEQRVVLEALARRGIDVYVWWTDGSHETIGDSRPFGERMPEWVRAEVIGSKNCIGVE